jgi:hypothetical protein
MSSKSVNFEFKLNEKHYCSFLGLNTIKANYSMLCDETFSDFTFVVQGTAFDVHKVVLANASLVFRSLFQSEMEELNVCKVEHIDKDTFWRLLLFIYCGMVEKELGNKAIKLYKAAYYYEIDDLKEICLREMTNVLTIENALKIHECAHHFDLNELKQKAWTIIKR